MNQNKNRFAAAIMDDSDDDVTVQKQTKTQKKKEERKITDVKPVKVNTNKMAEGGFEVVAKTDAPKPKTQGGPRPQTAGRGRGRGGGRGGDNRGPRPRPQLDAEGNPIKTREREPFRGKPDRKEGFGSMGGGRGRGDRKGGHGKGNWGDKQDVTFKQKGEAAEKTPEVVAEEAPEEEEKKEVEVVMETIGISMEEYLAEKMLTKKKEARAPEGIKGEKVQALDAEKQKQSTLLQNQYLKGAVAKTADANNVYLGFGAIKDDDDEVPSRGGRGARGGRGGKEQRGGARRQNPKQALKKTEEDFPTL